MAKLKIIDTRWLPFFSYFANKWDKTCGGNANRCTLPVCTCIASNTHTFPQRVNVQHQPHTPIVQIASFSSAASPPPRSVNRVQSIRVISCAEWTSCLTGCGLRGSWAQETRWAEAETPTPPPTKPFMSGNLYMPTKYWTVCKCVMYTQAPECNKEISGR